MARRGTGKVAVTGDFQEMSAALGVISGMTTTVKTTRFMSGVIEYAHTMMAQDFDNDMDFARTAAPRHFHHVYDWNTMGGKGPGGGRLWRHDLLGRGANREAAFHFIASRKPVPTPLERKAAGDQNLALIPDSELEKLSQRTYFFYNKAPVMEYNLRVTISPKFAKNLFIPTGDPSRPFIFSNRPVTVDGAGGQETTGQFTAFWNEWWHGPAAEKSFNDKVQNVIERDLGRLPIEGASSKFRRTRMKTGRIGLNDPSTAFEYGKQMSMRYLDGRAKTYSQARRMVKEEGL